MAQQRQGAATCCFVVPRKFESHLKTQQNHKKNKVSSSPYPVSLPLCLGVSWEWAKQLRLILHFEPGRYYTELEARWLMTMDTNRLRWTTINLIWSLHGPLEDLRQCIGQVDWIIAFGHNLAAKVPDCARIRKDLERRPRDKVVVIGDFTILYHTLAYSLLLDYSRSCIWHIQDLVSDVYIWLFCVSSCNHVYESIFCIYVFQNALLPTYNCLHSCRKGLVPLLGRLRQRVVGVAGKAYKFLLAGPHMCHISYLSPEAPSKFVWETGSSIIFRVYCRRFSVELPYTKPKS